jgi:Fungal N-terminal domain of STAND proteins
MDPVSALGLAASIDQFVELTASLASTLYSYYQKVKEAPKRSRELRAEVLLVSDVLQELGSIFHTIPSNPTPTNASLATTVDEFAKLLKDMSTRVTAIRNDEITKRLKWPFTQKQNEDFLARLERFKNTFNMALNTLVQYDQTLYCLISL